MASVQKITLSPSRDIPFNKLLLSQANVRRVKAGVSIEELADDIGRRGLLHGLSARAVVDGDGAETGMFEVPAGGRRFRALELLVKQKRLAKTAPVPCVVRVGGIAEEDSLAENVQRAPLHPLDQFRAFQRLREKGESEEEIAAAFFVPVSVVKQRLKLASVSDKLLEVYAEDGMTLDQLMAFTVSGDHARQEAAFERVKQGYDTQPWVIRRMLTETAVRAGDKRARFIGIDAYVEAGGCVMRDLFQSDEGGWLQDASLVDLMVAEKLHDAAQAVRDEGWKWVEVAPDFPYGHSYGLRQLRGTTPELTPEEQATRDAFQAELEEIEERYSGTDDDLPEEVDARLAEIETGIEALDYRPAVFAPDEIARAGAFVSIDAGGGLKVERGFVLPEDEAPVAPELEQEAIDVVDSLDPYASADDDGVIVPAVEPEEEGGIKPLSATLMVELSSWRTVALRRVLGERPDVAYRMVVHALALQTFYLYPLDSCMEVRVTRRGFGNVPGLADSEPAIAIADRHQAFRDLLPNDPQDLWDALAAMDGAQLGAILAHCVADCVNAVDDPYERRPRQLAHAEQLATALDLDVAAQGWTPTVETYLGRVTKARILAAVEEGCGSGAAEPLAKLKKSELAEAAEELLAGKHWLPEPLRTRPTDPEEVAAVASEVVVADGSSADAAGETVASGEADAAEAMTPDVGNGAEVEEPTAIAAE